ncbi:MAG TPA: toll/interleukin-1 receptor domain-containing protein [Thermoanaerobaculia bacterium]|nr:toll/interleukin-1 receptor domain-containing protein [Thermoanaerobaculia bacterium]
MRVFISHSASEKAFADAVRAGLIRRGFSVWNPDRELLPGDNWMLEAGRALERADAVVFILSADSIDSASAKLEIQYVIAQPKFEHRVFPVRVGKDVKKIPWVLRDLVIEAPAADAECVAREIAQRLQPAKSVRRLAASKRRLRSTTSPSVAASKTAKSRKGEPRRARRVVPNG